MPRALWNGAISFGLVNIPISMTTAVSEKSVHFHMLSEDGSCRLRRKLVCPETDKEYDFKETSRGYEIAPDQYVIVTDDELDKIKPEAGRALVITDFVPLDSIDPIYFDRSYYVLPSEGGASAYQLLVATMVETRKVALAHFVMHERQHLATLRVRDGVFVLHTMHYADEVTAASEVRSEAVPKVDKRELAVAQQLVDALSGPFKPEKYHDEYRRKIQEMIEKKSKGQVITAAAQEEEIPPTYNLMDALKRSVQGQTQGRKKSVAPAAAPGAMKKAKPERKKRTG